MGAGLHRAAQRRAGADGGRRGGGPAARAVHPGARAHAQAHRRLGALRHLQALARARAVGPLPAAPSFATHRQPPTHPTHPTPPTHPPCLPCSTTSPPPLSSGRRRRRRRVPRAAHPQPGRQAQAASLLVPRANHKALGRPGRGGRRGRDLPADPQPAQGRRRLRAQERRHVHTRGGQAHAGARPGPRARAPRAPSAPPPLPPLPSSPPFAPSPAPHRALLPPTWRSSSSTRAASARWWTT